MFRLGGVRWGGGGGVGRWGWVWGFDSVVEIFVYLRNFYCTFVNATASFRSCIVL